MKNRILHLNLKKKWFDMILECSKNEEYREIKPYWTKRFKDFLVEKPYDYILFKNGYKKNASTMKIELISIEFGYPKPDWADIYNFCYVLKLGRIMYLKNI